MTDSTGGVPRDRGILPFPSRKDYSVRIKWKRPDRATLQIAAFGFGLLGFGLGSGIIIGAELAPVETVERRTTVVLATAPVCRTAIEAAFSAFDLTQTRDVKAESARQHSNLVLDALGSGQGSKALEEATLADAEGIERDTAEFARIGQEQKARSEGALCLTHEAPARWNETVVAR